MMITKLESYTADSVPREQCLSVLTEATEMYEFEYNRVVFSDFGVLDMEELVKEQQLRESLEFYPFTKEQLLQAGEDGFIERTASYNALIGYLMHNYSMSNEEADEIVSECEYLITAGKMLQDIMGVLDNFLEMDNSIMQELVGYVIPLMNDTRQWYLKGHRSSELTSRTSNRVTSSSFSSKATNSSNVVQFPSGEKVGRNDACPCGSGKKYKKCCLN
ncbi:SEC-C domain-containing protein [Paenibacillus sp. GSMTC-2017]|nr:SEC-C domain-containing protein [Paenibacillus sp. GSMTC-2017]